MKQKCYECGKKVSTVYKICKGSHARDLFRRWRDEL